MRKKNDPYVFCATGRPAIVDHWNQVMQNNSFDALLSVIQTSQQPSIDGGYTYDIIHNATGSFVIPAASYTGSVPQVAGSGTAFERCCPKPDLRESQAPENLSPLSDKTRIPPVPASQADEVSDQILIRSRLAHA